MITHDRRTHFDAAQLELTADNETWTFALCADGRFRCELADENGLPDGIVELELVEHLQVAVRANSNPISSSSISHAVIHGLESCGIDLNQFFDRLATKYPVTRARDFFYDHSPVWSRAESRPQRNAR